MKTLQEQLDERSDEVFNAEYRAELVRLRQAIYKLTGRQDYAWPVELHPLLKAIDGMGRVTPDTPTIPRVHQHYIYRRDAARHQFTFDFMQRVQDGKP